MLRSRALPALEEESIHLASAGFGSFGLSLMRDRSVSSLQLQMELRLMWTDPIAIRSHYVMQWM